MAYSLVNASALGFDLVRLPGGPNVAEVVVRALDADEDLLQALANSHPGACRADCFDDVRLAAMRRPPMVSALELAGEAVDLAGAGDVSGSQELLTRLGSAPLGDLESLDRLVRHDVLDWTWEAASDGRSEVSLQRLRDRLAAEVLVDAAASAYCADLLADDVRRHLVAPYLAATRGAPGLDLIEDPQAEPAPLLGPGVGRALRQVSTWTEPDRDDWRAAVDLLRPNGGAWSAAMHDAGWAAHLSGRTRTAARTQLLAVLAFRHAGFTAADAAQGCWNALSGVLQAMTVSDLLGDHESATLLAPWHLARGGRPGSDRTTFGR